MRLTKYFSFLILGFLMSILLTACGSRGDLYQVEEPISANKTPIKGSQQMSQHNVQQNFQQNTKAPKKKSY